MNIRQYKFVRYGTNVSTTSPNDVTIGTKRMYFLLATNILFFWMYWQRFDNIIPFFLFFVKEEGIMDLLKHAITTYGKVLPGNVLKVGAFLNQQLDVNLLDKMAQEIYNKFANCEVNKILTVESSGIALACLTARFFNCNVVFAKKSKTSNVDGEVLTAKAYSYTHQKENTLVVPKEFLGEKDNVLVIDDFLAKGEAVNACIKMINDINAKLVGVAIAIEKGFQGGGDSLREKGVNLYSLAVIDSMENGEIIFR